MENRFNNLTSKEWLPFQKSWSIVESDESLFRDNLRFFTLSSLEPRSVFYSGPHRTQFQTIAESLQLLVTDDYQTSTQFAMIDIRRDIQNCHSYADIKVVCDRFLNQIKQLATSIIDRRFICVLAQNLHIDGKLVPVAWGLGKVMASVISLKDEKLLCKERSTVGSELSGKSVEYALYARRDDAPRHATEHDWTLDAFMKGGVADQFNNEIPSWFVLKPPPRKKGEVLHPAKYPESLAEMFIRAFSTVGSNVLDPMSGTGSTQMAAVALRRNAYGTELSPLFAGLANKRLSELCDPAQGGLFPTGKEFGRFEIVQADARQIPNLGFPEISFACTSPPYWDMLNMKGAENQARRIEQGLQTNYSTDVNDIGNIADYSRFLSELTDVYLKMFQVMKPGSYFTFVVKNIKKQGLAYPFAWDLTHRLLKSSIPIAEHFWLQNDLSIAPYGYGNTWVSNTFHQYCITVQLKT